MGVHTYATEFESPVAPARFFKASVLHMHELASKVMPAVVKSGAIVEGDGGVGSIKEYHFTEVIPFKHVRERVVELDKEGFVCKYSVIEGGTLGIYYKSATNKIKIVAGSNGGSVCKLEGEIHELDGVEYPEEEMIKTKEGSLATYKAVDAYLQANPHLYA